MPTITVLISGEEAVVISGHRYAFQRFMKLWIKRVVTTGFDKGRSTYHRNQRSPYPSMLEASLISFGIDLKRCLNINIWEAETKETTITPR